MNPPPLSGSGPVDEVAVAYDGPKKTSESRRFLGGQRRDSDRLD